MKKIIILVVGIVLIASVSFGASIPLKATWTPNTESDMAGYNLYRTDGSRLKVNTTLIPHPPTFPYLFSIIVPDNSKGIATFVLTAVDLSANESGDSNVASFPFDVEKPANPVGLGVTK